MGDRHDYVALEWVKGEIAETLKQARQSLEDYVEQPKDNTGLQFCLTYIHQVHGILQMVEFFGAALLAEEMEMLAQALVDGKTANVNEALEVLMQAILQLPRYLDRIQSARRDLPMAVLPLLNDLRAARGEKFLSQSSLFNPRMPAPMPPMDESRLKALDSPQLGGLLRKIRQTLQVALIGLLRDHESQQSLTHMARVFAGMEKLSNSAPALPLWQAASGLVDGLANRSLELSTSVRALLRQLDGELRLLVKNGVTELNRPVSDELLKNLLFYVAKSNPNSTRLQRLHEQYNLADALPAEVTDDARGGGLADRDAIRSVVSALCEELVRVKDSLDIFVRSDRTSLVELENLQPSLKQIADTLAVLGFAQQRKVVLDQAEVLDAIARGAVTATDASLMDVAGALLYLEATLIGMVGTGESQQSSAELAPPTDVAQVHRMVIREARTGLEQAKDGIIEFIASQWQHKHLEPVSELLNQVRGGLAMIPLERAARLVDCSKRYIDERILGTQAIPGWQDLDTLADAITGVDYYLERLYEDQVGDNELVLDSAAVSLGVLGYSPDNIAAVADEQEQEAQPVEWELDESAAEDDSLAFGLADAPDNDTCVLPEPVQMDDSQLADEGTLLFDSLAGSDELQAEPEEHSLASGPADEQPATGPEFGPESESLQLDTFELPEIQLPQAAAPVEPVAVESVANILATPASQLNPPATEVVEHLLPPPADEEPVDEELQEIFVEEAGEVLETLGEYFPKWRQDRDDKNSLTEVRRAFHTLKGSGRMVRALVIGELAWSIENMLNRVIEGSVEAGPELLKVIADVIGLTPELIEEYAALRQRQRDDVDRLAATAHALARREPVPVFDAPQPAQTPAEMPAVEQPEEPAPLQLADTVPGEPEQAAPEPVEPAAGRDHDLDPVLVEIFHGEAQGHLQSLQRFVADCREYCPRSITEDLQRAMHTLKGSAHMAGITPVAELATVCEKLVKEYRARLYSIGEQEADLLDRSAQLLEQGLLQLEDNPLQPMPGSSELIAQISLLLEQKLDLHEVPASQAAQPDPLLISSFLAKGMDLLLDMDRHLQNWREHPAERSELQQLIDELAALKNGAQMAELGSIEALVTALEQFYLYIHDHQQQLDDTQYAQVADAHEALINMMDEVAAGLDVTPQPHLVTSLQQLLDGAMQQDDGPALAVPELDDSTADFDWQPAGDEPVELELELPALDEPAALPVLELDDSAADFDWQPAGDETVELELELPALDEPAALPVLELDDSAADLDWQPDGDEPVELELELPALDEPAALPVVEQDDSAADLDWQPAGDEAIELELELPALDEPAALPVLELDDSATDFDWQPAGDGPVDLEFELPAVDEPAELPVVEVSDLPAEPQPVLEQVEAAPQPQIGAVEPVAYASFDPDMVEIFLDEAMDLLESANAGLEQWLDSPDNTTCLTALMRDLHTLKGGARMAEISPVGDLAHELESVYEGLLDGRYTNGSALDSILHQAHDQLAVLLEGLQSGEDLYPPLEAIERLKVFRKGVTAPQIKTVTEEQPRVGAVSSLPAAEVVEQSQGLAGVEEPAAEDGSRQITDTWPGQEMLVAPAELPDAGPGPGPGPGPEPEPEPEAAPATLQIPERDAELVEIFLEEAFEVLENVASSMQEWLSDRDNFRHVEGLQRDLHTLKGGARMAEITEVANLAHELEYLYEDLTNGRMQFSDGLDGFLYQAHDLLNEMLEAVRDNHPVVSETAMVERARCWRKGEPDPGNQGVKGDAAPFVDPQSQPVKVASPEMVQTFAREALDFIARLPDTPQDGDEVAGLLANLKGGASIAGLQPLVRLCGQLEQSLKDDDPQSWKVLRSMLEQQVKLLLPKVAAVSEPEAIEPQPEPAPQPVAASVPATVQKAEDLQRADALVKQALPFMEKARQAARQSQQQGPQEQVRIPAELLEGLVNLAGETSIFRGRVEQQVSDFGFTLNEMETTLDRIREQLRRLDTETQAQILSRLQTEGEGDYEDFDPLEMDRHSQLQQLSRSLFESASDLHDLKETLAAKSRDAETLLLQQARVNTELQEGLMRTRMVPFERLVPRLRRIVRQVAGELGKQVDLQVANAEGEMDRTVMERMVAPLEHMLRNAIGHGIEMPDVRESAGKPAMGRIRLELGREGADILLVMSDDGAGINVNAVRKKAIERGLMGEQSELSDQEIMQFILQAGFSTAEKITQVSGRGVGMDVVSSEIKQVGGSISIESEVGKGTRFLIRLPFTVSVNRALMVMTGEDLYAIPLNTVEGIVRVSPYELEALYEQAQRGERAQYEYAGQNYDLNYLGTLLANGQQPKLVGQSLPLPVLLVRTSEHAMAVQVDSLAGSREIVVKSLGPQFAGVPSLSGATILGDGRVVVILDLLAAIRSQYAQLGLSGSSTLKLQSDKAAASAGRVLHVMVVDDSVTVRKVTSRLLERNGMHVTTAKDGVDAINQLQEHRPDIMLLDIEMPRMDGFEVATLVRHDEQLRDLPIIMITSRTGDKHRERAMEIGVNEYLGKPYQEAQLLEKIRLYTE
ncbi:MAG: response regulator [Gammaproteobacteria bacterium]|nr:response regulator [Gammaproteobacteria bacterium]